MRMQRCRLRPDTAQGNSVSVSGSRHGSGATQGPFLVRAGPSLLILVDYSLQLCIFAALGITLHNTCAAFPKLHRASRNRMADWTSDPPTKEILQLSQSAAKAMGDTVLEAAGRRAIPYAKIAIGLLVLLAIVQFGHEAGVYVPHFAQWVETLGPWGPAAFIVGYAVAVVAFVPGSVLTLAAGAIFGLAQGTLVVFLGATLGSIAAFLVSRYMARDAVARRVEGDRRFTAIDSAVERQGRQIVFLLRLSPIFPFSLLNYALGLTRVRLADYALASFGMLPGTLLYVYSGKVAGELAALAGNAGVQRGASYYAVVGLGFLATVIVTVIVTRVARRALREATGE